MGNTVVQKAINQYGIDNIFMINSDYHGYYQDDYCTFTYYNNITGEIFKDEWTTAAACPAFGNYECKTFKDAFNEGLVNKELLLEYFKKMNKTIINNSKPEFRSKELKQYHLRVSVSTGRKWKGIGYLVDCFDKSYQWGQKLWRSDNDYGVSSTSYCKIYDPLTNRIEVVTSGNISFLNSDLFIKEYKDEMLQKIDDATVDNITENFKLNYGLVSFVKWLAKYKNSINLSMAYDVEKEERLLKEKEFKESKMPGIIEWVKNNTDKKTEEDIMALAEHIFNKKYS